MSTLTDSPFKSQTLGIISNKHLWADSEGLKTQGGFGRQIEEICRYFGKVILVTPYESRPKVVPGYIIKIDNLELLPIAYHSGTGVADKLNFIFKFPHIMRQVWHAYQHSDVLHYRLPGYVGLTGLLVHKILRRNPGFAWLATDWPDRIRSSGNTLTRRSMAWIAEKLLVWLMNDVSTFAVGHMAAHYQRTNHLTHGVITTVISDADIFDQSHTNISNNPQLLYVGRLSMEKGLPYLLEAVAQCQKHGLEAKLVLVGEGRERKLLEDLCQQLHLEERVQFKGYVPLGESLWSLYRQSDIFILPSLSEGQPKVLVEAMAAGIPIIATQTGGIPTIVQHRVNGLLVAPRSPQAIRQAIEFIVQDTTLQTQMTQNGLVSARLYTIEAQTRGIIQQLVKDFPSQGWSIIA